MSNSTVEMSDSDNSSDPLSVFPIEIEGIILEYAEEMEISENIDMVRLTYLEQKLNGVQYIISKAKLKEDWYKQYFPSSFLAKKVDTARKQKKVYENAIAEIKDRWF